MFIVLISWIEGGASTHTHIGWYIILFAHIFQRIFASASMFSLVFCMNFDWQCIHMYHSSIMDKENEL